jgi:transposase-like protein
LLKIDGALKAKIALEALREQWSVADLAQRYQVHPNQICTCKRQLQDQAARAFEAGSSMPADHEHKIERLHTKLSELIVERVFLALVRKMSIPDRRAMLDPEHAELSIRRAVPACT